MQVQNLESQLNIKNLHRHWSYIPNARQQQHKTDKTTAWLQAHEHEKRNPSDLTIPSFRFLATTVATVRT